MFNRKSTVALARMLDALVVDLKTELEIMSGDMPSVQDHHSVLYTAWQMANHGVELPGTRIEGRQLFIIEMFEFKGQPGVTMEVTMQFDGDQDNMLVDTTVFMRGATLARCQGNEFVEYLCLDGRRGHEFKNVDIGAFTSVPNMCSPYVNMIFSVMFNSEYSRDFVHMSELALDTHRRENRVTINGQYYTDICGAFTHCFHPDKAVHDLIELAAKIFAHSQPQHGNIDFALNLSEEKPPRPILCVEE